MPPLPSTAAAASAQSSPAISSVSSLSSACSQSSKSSSDTPPRAPKQRSASVASSLPHQSQTTTQPYISITVQDRGIGIPLAKQKSIFAAFSQADNSIQRKYGGTGTGDLRHHDDRFVCCCEFVHISDFCAWICFS
jgi:hypothetical protein